jgi:hypothetical protein
MTREELVKEMYEAFTGAATISGKASMSAALDVAIEELLKTPDRQEWYDAYMDGFHVSSGGYPRKPDPNISYGLSFECGGGRLFANLRAKFQKVKTPEERVTVDRGTESGWRVLLDGESQFWQISQKHAEIYRLGLIAKLKQEGRNG